ncbi:hypothetical protein RRG08_018740 [Elysia crispata]|uniref:Uncharacterized protein n=1 Tax=Elysia crispata TaxID=231223 RepID=A0AAE0XTD0_9GAST|nr:hypothetical protein RRG08_018740 [Elysia crispata]
MKCAILLIVCALAAGAFAGALYGGYGAYDGYGVAPYGYGRGLYGYGGYAKGPAPLGKGVYGPEYGYRYSPGYGYGYGYGKRYTGYDGDGLSGAVNKGLASVGLHRRW